MTREEGFVTKSGRNGLLKRWKEKRRLECRFTVFGGVSEEIKCTNLFTFQHFAGAKSTNLHKNFLRERKICNEIFEFFKKFSKKLTKSA